MSLTETGRIAIREEGDFVNAYWCKPDTMEGAILLASIRVTLLDGRKGITFTKWIEALQSGMSRGFKETIGREPNAWEIRDAPPHEKTRKE